LRKYVLLFILVIGLVAAGLISYLSFYKPCFGVPSVSVAPFMITTSSRTYYAEKATEASGFVVLENYYESVNNKWERNQSRLYLGPDFLPKIIVR
jgi:hypothetical protein